MTGEMEAALLKILQDVYDKTGVEVSLERDEKKQTAFTIDYGGQTFQAYLSGTQEEANLVAYLVKIAGENLAPQDKDETLRGILLGEGNKAYAHQFLAKYNCVDGACFALDIVPERRLDEALLHVQTSLIEENAFVVKMDSTRIAVVMFSKEGETPVELGNFLNQSLYEEVGVKAKIGIGCEEKSFGEIATSYAQALTAVRMSGILGAKGEVHSYREFLLTKMLEDVPAERLKEYVEQFHIEGAKEIFSDEEMTTTAEEFLENSLNLSETSRNLFMHRNTLMYRLDKIERLTGLNIRQFSDAVTFRVISILFKLLQS